MNEAIELLKKHQDWKKGESDVPTDPAELTAAIDVVIRNYEQPTCKCKTCKCKKQK